MRSVPDDWTYKTLPEISTVFTDGPFGSNLKSSHYTTDGVRVIRLQNIGIGKLLEDDIAFISKEHFRSLPRHHCRPGDVIIGTLGDPNLRACILPSSIPEALNKADCLLLRLDEDLADRRFISAVLNSDRTVQLAQRLVRGQTRGRISMGRLKELKIPLPPLAEQKRIAGILDAADALRAKRRDSLAQLDSLLKSSFLDLFGDPVSNPMEWPVVTIGDLLTSTAYGTSKKAHTSESGLACLRMNNITYAGGWDFSSLKYVDLEPKEISKNTVKRGQILFNRTNSKELVGKTAVYRRDTPMAFAGYLVRGITNAEADPEYISAFLNLPQGKAILQGMCKSIVGMANINAQEFKSIPIPKPPLPMQRRFAAIVESVERQKERQRAHLAELDALFAALQHRAFRGEL